MYTTTKKELNNRQTEFRTIIAHDVSTVKFTKVSGSLTPCKELLIA